MAQLPGEEREQDWIRKRLGTLSVREGYALIAAVTGSPPENVAIFEGTPLVPAEPNPTPEPSADVQEPAAPVRFHWGYVLVPLGVVAAIGGGTGVALFIKKRREGGYETEEDSQ